MKLIKRLSEDLNIYSTEKFHFLSAVGRSWLHRTIGGNQRSVLEVKIGTVSSQFVILEIDTSDNSKPASTLIIRIDGFYTWNEILKIIVKRLLYGPKVN